MTKSERDESGLVAELDSGSVPAFDVMQLAERDWRRQVTLEAERIDRAHQQSVTPIETSSFDP